MQSSYDDEQRVVSSVSEALGFATRPRTASYQEILSVATELEKAIELDEPPVRLGMLGARAKALDLTLYGRVTDLAENGVVYAVKDAKETDLVELVGEFSVEYFKSIAEDVLKDAAKEFTAEQLARKIAISGLRSIPPHPS